MRLTAVRSGERYSRSLLRLVGVLILTFGLAVSSLAAPPSEPSKQSESAQSISTPAKSHRDPQRLVQADSSSKASQDSTGQAGSQQFAQADEENLVPGTGDGLDLIGNKEITRQIKSIIEPHIGFLEIVACEIWSLEYLPSDRAGDAVGFLGYDIAYLGGDFYSAVLNGLFVNPAPALLLQYKSLTNRFGLFPTTTPIPEYVSRFKQEARSEESAEFYVWALELVG